MTKCRKNTWVSVHGPYRVHLEGRSLNGQVLPLPVVSQANKLYLESQMFQLCPESHDFPPSPGPGALGSPSPSCAGPQPRWPLPGPCPVSAISASPGCCASWLSLKNLMRFKNSWWVSVLSGF